MSEYYSRYGILDNRLRNLLTRLIVDHEYKNSIRKDIPFALPKNVMEEITHEIKQFFHNEPEDVYFRPSRNGRNPSGKLLKSFENLKAKLKKISQRPVVRFRKRLNRVNALKTDLKNYE